MADKTNKQRQDDQNTQADEQAFSSINPDELSPELQEVYKSMQADYTRKTQEIANLRKDFASKEAQWEEKLKSYGAIEHENRQWRDWYKSLEEQAEEADGQHQTPTDTDASLPNYLEEPGSGELKKYVESLQQTHKTEIGSLKQEIESLQAALKDTTVQTSRMFNYHAQLNELAGKYPNLNKQELLDHALQTGQTDLEKAYRDKYQDDIITQMVEERVEERLAKERTKGIKSTGQQFVMKPSKDAPKNWAEATQQILDERAAQGL
jgi:hypothetical protein